MIALLITVIIVLGMLLAFFVREQRRLGRQYATCQSQLWRAQARATMHEQNAVEHKAHRLFYEAGVQHLKARRLGIRLFGEAPLSTQHAFKRKARVEYGQAEGSSGQAKAGQAGDKEREAGE